MVGVDGVGEAAEFSWYGELSFAQVVDVFMVVEVFCCVFCFSNEHDGGQAEVGERTRAKVAL